MQVQVGKGLYPREWVQIGGDVTTPVINGPLAEWDTTGLSGLYALQLVVVYTDQKVETAVVLVHWVMAPAAAWAATWCPLR